jgi:hypothetical protein
MKNECNYDRHERHMKPIREAQLLKDNMDLICALCDGVGWVDTFNTQDRVQEIQKCDDCNIFKDDEQARQGVSNEV